MAKQHGKPTLAQKKAASAAANVTHVKSQQTGAEQPVETALAQAMRAATENVTVTVTAVPLTGNGGTISSQEALPPVPVAEPKPEPSVVPVVPAPAPVPATVPASTPMPEPVQEPVLAPVTDPAPEPTPEPAQHPIQEPVTEPAPALVPVSAPVAEPTASAPAPTQQQVTDQKAVYQPSEGFKKTYGFW